MFSILLLLINARLKLSKHYVLLGTHNQKGFFNSKVLIKLMLASCFYMSKLVTVLITDFPLFVHFLVKSLLYTLQFHQHLVFIKLSVTRVDYNISYHYEKLFLTFCHHMLCIEHNYYEINNTNVRAYNFAVYTKTYLPLIRKFLGSELNPTIGCPEWSFHFSPALTQNF